MKYKEEYDRYMWISDENTFEDLKEAIRDPTVRCLYFTNVYFVDSIVKAMSGLKGRPFTKLGLISCRGKLAAALSFLLEDTAIVSLRIDGMDLCANGAKELGAALAKSTTMNYLSLQALPLTAPLIEALSHGLIWSKRLETLVFNHVTAPSNPLLVDRLLEGLSQNTSLSRLEILRVPEISGESLFRSVRSHPSLMHLSVMLVNLEEDTAKAIGELSTSPQSVLRTLKLSIRGIWSHVDSLPCNSRFKLHLDLSTFRYKCLEILGKTLVQNGAIESLNLAYQGLPDSDISLLAPFLGQAKGLKSVNLYGNTVSEKGGQSLLLAMKSNHQIESIDLPYPCPQKEEINLYADMNKGGRKIFLDSDASSSIWPHVLERAGQLQYNPCAIVRLRHENERRAANVVYNLLHGPATLH